MTHPDTSRPNIARVQNALLGGRDSFAADRAQAEALTRIRPDLPALAREDREFLARAVTWAARQGVRQFADIGTGLPAPPTAGQAARAIIPGAKVVYVDNDPRSCWPTPGRCSPPAMTPPRRTPT